MEYENTWNRGAKPVLDEARVTVLPSWRLARDAWNAHVDFGDCTHFCQASGLPPDLWARALAERLSCWGAAYRVC